MRFNFSDFLCFIINCVDAFFGPHVSELSFGVISEIKIREIYILLHILF